MTSAVLPPFFRMGLRAFLRDWRAGELRLLLLALMIAVAAITSVGFLADRAGQVLERDAAQMLGGDLVLRSNQPLPDSFAMEAVRQGLTVGHTVQFPSMAMHGEASVLVSLKAVDPAYPLRGALQVSVATDDPVGIPAAGPEPGTLWVDNQLLGMLGATLGSQLVVGDLRLEVAGIIRHEPDRGTQFINLAPRLMMHLSDLPAANLMGPGSRVRHHLLLAGEAPDVRAYRQWVEPRLERGQRLSVLEDSRPEVTRVLDRAERFLVLVALLSVLVAAIAIGLAARQYTRRHTDGVAILRCLGAGRGLLLGMLWVEFALVALVGATAGIALGFLAHYGLVDMLAGWIDTQLPAPTWKPALQGWASGCLLLLGFALPPLAGLRHVPPARVLRRDAAAGSGRRWPAYAGATVAFLILIGWTSGDLPASLIVVLGFVGAFLVFALIGLALVWSLNRWRHEGKGSLAWRFALSGMARRRGLTLAQLCSLALGIMLLLLLGILRGDLLRSWQQSLPPDAPNVFLINIQPDQTGDVARRVLESGLPQPWLYPMVRARLVAINDRPVQPSDYEDERAQRLVDREFNLSVAEHLPEGNEIVAGRWLNPQANELSLEDGMAESLGVNVGDTMRFDLAGRQVDVVVSGLRKVNWDSFQVNFFAVMSPVALGEDVSASYITSMQVPPAAEALKRDIVQAHPNVTVFDIGVIVAQVRQMLERAVSAVQLLFAFTLFAGILVLAAAMYATRDERMHEVAVMRALGARADLLRGALFRELLLCGAIAGVLAAAGAICLSWVLADRILQVELVSVWWPWPAGIVAGVLAALLAGRFALSGVLRASPLSTLREVA